MKRRYKVEFVIADAVSGVWVIVEATSREDAEEEGFLAAEARGWVRGLLKVVRVVPLEVFPEDLKA